MAAKGLLEPAHAVLQKSLLSAHLTPEDSNIRYILSSCGCADCQQKRPPRAHLPAQILMAKLALAKSSCKNSASSIEGSAAKLLSDGGLAAAASANFRSTWGAMSLGHVGPRKDHASCEIVGSPTQSPWPSLMPGSLSNTHLTGFWTCRCAPHLYAPQSLIGPRQHMLPPRLKTFLQKCR